MYQDPRGSIWRKWDLHIHTPASYHWEGTSHYKALASQEEKWKITKSILEAIESSDVTVFGINDYWTFDGYFTIRDFIENQREVETSKVILPGMELRIEAPTNFRLNIHVILSNQMSPQQIKDFKSRLKIRAPNSTLILSDDGLIEFASRLDDGKAGHHGFASPENLNDFDLWQLGCQTAEITRDSFVEAVNIHRDNVLVLVPYGTYNGLRELDWKNQPASDLWFMQIADMVEGRSLDDRDLFLGIRTPKNEKYLDDFYKTTGNRPKPCVSGSDAHHLDKYGEFVDGKATWLKADATFLGLKQVVNQPTQRSYIGLKPPQLDRVHSNPTKYIDAVEIKKKDDSEFDDEIWFNNFLYLNHGLVAIIGNRGGGKSALVDILGILGNTERDVSYFSFLNRSKFRRGQDKAQHYIGTIYWVDDTKFSRGLDEDRSIGPEKVKYIPQNFFEVICNETEIRKDSQFDQELKSVIYSHVPDHDKLGASSLDQLLGLKTKEIEHRIRSIARQVKEINKQIIELEYKITPNYGEHVKALLDQKKIQLTAHLNAEPSPVEKLNADTEAHPEIDELDLKIQQTRQRQHQLGPIIKRLKLRVRALEDISHAIADFEINFEELKERLHGQFVLVEFEFSELVRLETDTIALNKKLDELKSEQSGMIEEFNDLNTEVKEFKNRQDELTDALQESDRAYRRYLENNSAWEEEKRNLIGDLETPDTIKYLEQQLIEIESTIPNKLEELRKKRLSLSLDILEQIKSLATIYEKLYEPVQDFIDKHILVKDKYKLDFEVTIKFSDDFIDKFLSNIKQNISGSFLGTDSGRLVLEELIEGRDFSHKDSVTEFVQDLEEHIKYDHRTKPPTRIKDVETQLAKGVSIEDIYNLIFSLEYIRPNYALTLDSKDLTQLSPGERGLLLLIFYLLIDKEDSPLIIDQPEENLDNQSVYQLLVDCVKEAKNKRQIIMVTHNPNLAVACDADQIIYAEIDKANRNEVRYESGAIENPRINKRIIDVLEGTLPAFMKRDATYHKLT